MELKRWVLDDGVFDDLAQVLSGKAFDSWPPEQLLLPSTTRDAASNDQSGRRPQLLMARSALGKPVFGTAAVQFASSDPASQTLAELHQRPSSVLDLAEHEAIAWVLHHGDSIFVSVDRRAILTALAELGRNQVAHAFDLWLFLLGEQLVTKDEFDALCRKTLTRDQGLPRLPARVR